MVEARKLNVGIVGYGFMGRTHSNAFNQVTRFFTPSHRPVLKAVCGRDAAKVQTFAQTLGPAATNLIPAANGLPAANARSAPYRTAIGKPYESSVAALFAEVRA